MNANAFCVRNRAFAMRVDTDLVLEVPPERVAALIAIGMAMPNVVGGRPMKEWANRPPASENEWPGLAKESLEYVRSKR
jgi:hypothetical protein